MSDLKTLIETIETNEKAIAEFEVQAQPHVEQQMICAVNAKKERVAGRACQASIDDLLAPAQVLRFANQQLKLEAGQLALNERKNQH